MRIPWNKICHVMVRGNYYPRRTLLSKMRKHLAGKGPDRHEIWPPPLAELYDEKRNLVAEQQIRDFDIPFVIHGDLKQALVYLSRLERAISGDLKAAEKVDLRIQSYVEEREPYYLNFPIQGDSYVIPCTSREVYPESTVSNKGAMLLNLSHDGFPVPDFVVVTSDLYHLEARARERSIHKALDILERLTIQQLGSSDSPLIFALRCAMPCYMPGVMPTFLNVGVTESTIPALVRFYGEDPAYKMFLNNMKNILLAEDPEGCEQVFDSEWMPDERLDVQAARAVKRIKRIDPGLLQDPYRQTAFFIEQAYKYFSENWDLMLTFSKGEAHYPSLILQRMLCTVREERSRIGVIFSRHPRTGRGGQIESARRVFGEEIMAGTVATEKVDFVDREDIKKEYPAVARFLPALRYLETKLQSPVTIEFATDITDRYEFFNLLQLNASEITGRSAFISALDMYNTGIISRERVPELIRPFHLRQIESDAIDPESFNDLTVFSKAASVLPRTALTARIFFSAQKALDSKKAGDKVCLCQNTFLPSDTPIMGEVDSIVSLTSAAIHVITICQGYGLPALLDLERHGVCLEDNALINSLGMVIREGDWVTVSSRKKCLYVGKARFKPARLIRYMKGQPVQLDTQEIHAFEQMSRAYREYHVLLADLQKNQTLSLAEIIRLVNLEYRGKPKKSKTLVNRWFDSHTDLYVSGVLESDMGDHLRQSTVFDLLTQERKIKFFKQALGICRSEQRSGFSAGMFMLGRFVSLAQPIVFWKSLNAEETAQVVNEWLLFEKYLHLLHLVGERKIHRAKQKILQEGLAPIQLNPARIKSFIPLKLSKVSLPLVKSRIPLWCDRQTEDVLELLHAPYSAFYDFKKSWSFSALKELCEREGIPVPSPEDR